MNKLKKLSLMLILFVLCVFAGVPTIDLTFASAKQVTADIDYITPLQRYVTDGDKVYNSKGVEITLTDGSFIATEIDTYRIEKDGKIIKLVKVLASVPDASFEMCSEFPTTCIAGQTVTLPAADVFFLGQKLESYSVIVYLEDAVMKEFVDVNQEIRYTFSKSNEYTIKYSVVHLGKESSRVFTLTPENKPVFLYEKDIPAEIANKNFYKFGEICGYFEEKRYPVSITVTDVNGVSSNATESFIPNGVGEYTIEIKTVINNEPLTETKKIMVKNTNASFFGAGAGITSVEANVDSPIGGKWKGTGVETCLSGKGAYVYYNKIINLNELSKDDAIVSFYVKNGDGFSLSNVRATLIDANDPNNKISVYWYQSQWENNWSYCLVEFNGYSLGLNNEKADGKPRAIFGTALSGTSFKTTTNVNPFNFSFDAKENAVYTNTGSKLSPSYLKVLDLDSETDLGERNLFKGFSSNQVYLKIEINQSVDARILLLDAGGESFNEQLDTKEQNFLRFNYDDNYSPKTLYDGALGYDYTLPMPITNDLINGHVDVTTKLYFVDGNSESDITNMIQNGKFSPTQVGEYKVVYYCTDSYGNEIEKTFMFHVNENPPSISILNEDVSLVLGSLIKEPELEIIGGTGKLNVTTTYTYNGEIVEPNINGYLYLKNKGSILVEVRVVDFLGVIKAKVFNIIINNDLCILEVEEQPVSLIAGRQYTLSDFNAYDYAFEVGQEGFEMSKTILVDGVAIGNDRKYTFNNAGESVITYIGGFDTDREIRKEVKVRILPATNNNSFDIKNYIQTDDGVQTLLFQNGVGFNADKDFNIYLPNAIPANGFQISFSAMKELANFNSVTFLLEDYKNPNQQLLLEVKGLAGDSWTVTVNNKFEYTLATTAGKYGDNESTFYDYSGKDYKSATLRLYPYQNMLTTDTDLVISELKNYLSGDVFTGFDSGIVRVNIAVKGVSKSSSFVLDTIGNQNLTNISFRRGDRLGPMIGTVGSPVKDSKINHTVILPRAIAYDVLQGKAISLTGYVQTPNGNVVIDPMVDTTFTITSYGVYNVVYEAEDFYKNVTTYEYVIYCNDRIMPEITLPTNLKTEYKIGESITLPEFQATDNVGISKTCIFIKTPENRMVLTNGKYTFTIEGKYELIFYACDEFGNIKTESISLEVE